ASQSMERTLALGQPSEQELETAQRLLEDEAAQPLLYFAARGERAGTHRILEALAAGEIGPSQLSGTPKPGTGEKLGLALMAGRIKRTHALILRMETDLLEISKQPTEQQPD